MSEDLFLDLGGIDEIPSGTEDHDVIIIGGGPAGLSAGLYTARANLDTLLIEKGPLGGQLNWIKHIENYPGFPEGISGTELIRLMEAQARKFGMRVETGNVIDISIDTGVKIVKTDVRNFRCKALIITTGISRKQESIEGEQEFRQRGVSYCATCDAPFFKNADVVVVGGGEEALEEALALTKFAGRVTIIHSQDDLSASDELREIVMKNEKISILLNSQVTKISGKDRVDFVEMLDLNTGDTKRVTAKGVFLYIGTRPVKEFLSLLVEVDEHGYIITDEEMKTSTDGIFAAGDVRNKKVRQVATAVGDGVISASSARSYIQKLQGRKPS